MYFRMHRNVSVDKKNNLDVPRTLKVVFINVRENIISIGKKKGITKYSCGKFCCI